MGYSQEELVPADSQPALAPWQHTVAIAIAVSALAVLAHLSRGPVPVGSHLPGYIAQSIMIWMILGSVVAGVYHRRLFFFQTLVQNRGPLWRDGLFGIAIYGAMFMAFGLVMFAAYAFLAAHHAHDTHLAGKPTPEMVQAIQREAESKLHLNRTVVEGSAPRTGAELLMWLAVSITAGFCEEHIFRGYLLRQGMAWMSQLQAPRWLGTVIAVAGSSLLFGSLHMYEGAGGAVFITCLGAFYCGIALYFGNLRAVIAAHVLQDFAAGLLLFLRYSGHGPH